MPKVLFGCPPQGDGLVVSASLHRYLTEYCRDPHFRPEFKRRSHLFVPLIKPRFLEKIGRGEVGADGFIWDLEDSAPPDQKPLARSNIALIPPKPGIVEYNVRINVGSPEELARDLEVITHFPFDSVTLPKGEDPSRIAHLMSEIGEEKAYIVTIETLRGLDALNEIASVLRPGKDALGFGVGDMSTELGVERLPTTHNPLFQQMLGTIAMAAKKHQLDLFDSVSAKFNDSETARAESELSCYCFGYTGKKSINPKQIEMINAVFSPQHRLLQEYLATLECFIGDAETNAHVVHGEYRGLPAFKSADHHIKKYLRQGYLTLPPLP